MTKVGISMDSLKIRSELGGNLRRLVIKVGSAALASESQGLDLARLAIIADECQVLHSAGIEVLLVSSGSILAGRGVLPQNQDRNEMAFLQACSAVGQPMLMAAYRSRFSEHKIACGQVLLTHADVSHLQRYLNLRNTLLKLLEARVIPIINENDPVSFAEITVGDNDQLAAMATEIVSADGLILLTSPDGLFSADPTSSHAKKIDYVSFEDDLAKVNTSGKSAAGRGGMRTKLEAAGKATRLGIPVIISSFKVEYPIRHALSGGGTFFEAAPTKSPSQKKRWLLSTTKSDAFIRVDEGAYKALLTRKSLLPSGIIEVKGTFRRGDSIKILYGSQAVAIGLTEYGAEDLGLIMSKKSQEIQAILGTCPSKVAIHSNNLILRV